MDPISLTLPPGLSRQGTQLKAAGRWNDGQYFRFAEGVIRPMKGWATGLAGTLSGSPRAAHAWLDNDEAQFAAFGTTTNLYAHDGSVLDDITPSTFDGATIWSLDNFGEVLIACDGETIYDWQPGGGGDATPIANAPSAKAIFVTEERFLMALGVDGDPRQFAWADQESRTVWTPTAINQAGDLPIQATGLLVCGLKIRGSSLLFTTEGLHRLDYRGQPDVYGSEHIANGCGIISQHAKVGFGSTAYWMGKGGFWSYSGYLEQIPCEISDDVFSNLNTTYQHLCWAEFFPLFGEVWFYYPRGAATECSHAAIFSTREGHWNHTPMARLCGFGPDVFGWPVRVTSAGAMAKHEYEYNYSDALLTLDTSDEILLLESGEETILLEDGDGLLLEEGSPVLMEGSSSEFLLEDGSPLLLESATDVERKLVSGPVQIANGGRAVFLDEIWPDEQTQGDCDVYLHVRDYPNASETTLGPYSASDRIGVMTTARQIRFELRMATGKTDARIGDWRAILKTRGRY